MQLQDIAGKTVIVTGAAGGIGRVVVESFVQQGAHVAAVDCQSKVMERFQQKPQVTPFCVDISDVDAVEELVETVENRIGAIDILANVAGVLHLAEVDALTQEDWEQTFEVNATSLFIVTKAISRRMKSREQGSIVVVSSNAGRMPRMSMAAYAASKAAATMYTKCLGLELASYNIRCNVVSPGSTETDMLRQLWTDANGAEQSIKGTQEAYRLGIPLQKLGQAQDVADTILFLASDCSGHMTMEDICVDGGATLGV
ncbi:2,3-dihydro-2,3-dihydroxybenzoate dehydrogenase [Gracilibacillus caseinilyticus]|uniref:2,3-dihydro-2,3-dihydroxybenzoate dehydrogenase n=1 Tax=Gracilibacillus caseinilyticus TaxID=2932256 RepID=A0ABY4F2L4_9BACI|nr:2,3-dihydro-2,3-dihydroxybenzoate dehydrogenase [Gracilibacillus caseinilyticus]UOQ48671.1 2,3-dihydro-2,3-dihydroxybenzoate dehydrogenase [Gracilibacillus caseinilyticus]